MGAMAKRELSGPSFKQIEAASPITVAAWDDGIPPEPMSLFTSQCFSLYLNIVTTLMPW